MTAGLVCRRLRAPPPPLAFLFSPQPHPPISISHACSCAGLTLCACVSLSGTRSISNTKGSEQPEPVLPQHRRRTRVENNKVLHFSFSSALLSVFMLIVFHSRDAHDLVTRSHLSFLIDLPGSSAPSFADVYVAYVCVCVCACCKWAGTLNLIRLEMRKADVNRPNCHY